MNTYLICPECKVEFTDQLLGVKVTFCPSCNEKILNNRIYQAKQDDKHLNLLDMEVDRNVQCRT